VIVLDVVGSGAGAFGVTETGEGGSAGRVVV